ncbi:uncharacterized protein LOC111346782 [Stylophora pistillata]|uniref:uncharacterized protein LOC111346782 n=1 Tax=Stylophora pistillata TaxID=50429 RepID=UPI000C04236B|nr:uncharacterized protein LOC111346782 [Stylophora pistillata]
MKCGCLGVKTFLFILVRICLRSMTVEAKEDTCRYLKFNKPTRGFALEGHALKKYSIGLHESCKNLCTMDSRCVSFNAGPSAKVADHMVCELSDSDAKRHPGDLKPRVGFVYRDTENLCRNIICSHNGTCLTGYTYKGYFCDCKAGSGFTGEHCEKENWKKVNDAAVCFGGVENTQGDFSMRESGLIFTFKLVYRSGDGIKCNPDVSASYWGCMSSLMGEKKLVTVITFPNKTALPIADYARDTSSCGFKYHSYQLNGTDVNSPELVFKTMSRPLPVSIGQVFQIWYAEVLDDCAWGNNSGQTCADVYAWYA